MLDSTVVRRARPPPRRESGQQGQALGALTRRIFPANPPQTDLTGLRSGFHLTGGESMTAPTRTVTRHRPDITPRAVVTRQGL